MCGIFGFLGRAQARISHDRLNATMESLFRLSESRGKESIGYHLYLPIERAAWTFKAAKSASQIISTPEYRQLTSDTLKKAFSDDGGKIISPIAVLAHSRLVTNGTAATNENNQPVRSSGVTIIHNGIIVNADQLWADHPNVRRTAEVDTEVMAALLSDAMNGGISPIQATVEVFQDIRGAASVAWVHDRMGHAILATNTGDLYYYFNKDLGYTLFASERFILTNALRELAVEEGGSMGVQWLPAGYGFLVDLRSMDGQLFELKISTPSAEMETDKLLMLSEASHCDLKIDGTSAPYLSLSSADYSLLRYGEDRLKELKRCTNCVLPETFPFINFDNNGVCNYCHGYRPRYKGLDADAAKTKFLDVMRQYRRADGSPDVLVPFSGGRDSSYGLHLIKEEFGFTPITFTYDWGMVTDLARRNIARMCGQLGVQNILVSADIKVKRENIRKNVSAWLRKPDLGMIPLFMAGDKHFFSIVNKLKRQTGIRLDLWSANPLENTDFKSGFCGVEPDFDKSRLDYLSMGRKVRMVLYYAKNFMTNPMYINSSLLDTAGAFFAYYFEPRRDFYFMFNDLVWDEHLVNHTLLNRYDWELASDTASTWRIGDGTAPFYNYIYVTARGFSEFDTFRSNQIREGMISREQAMNELFIENRPRAESMRWYLDAIGLDFNDTVKAINKLDRLSLHQ